MQQVVVVVERIRLDVFIAVVVVVVVEVASFGIIFGAATEEEEGAVLAG